MLTILQVCIRTSNIFLCFTKNAMAKAGVDGTGVTNEGVIYKGRTGQGGTNQQVVINGATTGLGRDLQTTTHSNTATCANSNWLPGNAPAAAPTFDVTPAPSPRNPFHLLLFLLG